jgi:hypothetical protein
MPSLSQGVQFRIPDLMSYPERLAGVAGALASLGVCSGHQHPTMTARNSRHAEEVDRPNSQKHVSNFWQECERYHDLAEAFTRDIVITHPSWFSGRSPREGCSYIEPEYAQSTVKYYERIPKARHSTRRH